MADNPAVGGSFDDFLAEEGLLVEAEAVAAKRVLSWQLGEYMKTAGLSDAQLAKRIGISVAEVEHLLNPDSEDVSPGALAIDRCRRVD